MIDTDPLSEITRAVNIFLSMNEARRSEKGAFGLEIPGSCGEKEMIDEPMLKQVRGFHKIYIHINLTTIRMEGYEDYRQGEACRPYSA